METTTIILIVAAVGIIIMIYLRFYKQPDKFRIPEKPPYISEIDTITVPEAEEAEYDIPQDEIERVVPDEEIAKVSDAQDKELIRIDNYFISNVFENLVGDKFFNVRENILMDDFIRFETLFEVRQIFQISENIFVSIIDLPDVKILAEDQQEKSVMELLGNVEFDHRLGFAWIDKYNEAKEAERKKEAEKEDNVEALLIADVFIPENEIRIGSNLLHAGLDVDMTFAEKLSHEIEEFGSDYIAYINDKSVYIRINRPARLDDVKTMVGILRNLQDRVNGTHIPSGIPYG